MSKYLFSFVIALILGINFVLPQQVTSSGGDYYENSSGSISLTVGESIVETYTSSSGILTTGFQQPSESIKIFTLKLFLEGLYAGGGFMNKAQNGTGNQFPGTIADQVTVVLHDATSPFGIALSFGNVDLNTDGTLAITSIPASLTGSYYTVIKHRNSIETWSKHPVSFSGSVTNYDFSTADTLAYGDNMNLVGSVYAIWGGDATQDGVVDTGDMNVVENESTLFTMDYVPEDVNGDGIVDTGDMILVENNSNLFVMIKAP